MGRVLRTLPVFMSFSPKKARGKTCFSPQNIIDFAGWFGVNYSSRIE
jgi:hypothetical protein